MIHIDHVQKISLSGILLALVIIFTRFFAIQNIPIIPFVRLSLGPALIIFASLLLGPIYGGLIGGLSDILGIVLVPNALGYSINPFFTLVYAILGILPWCFLKLIQKVKNNKALFFATITILFLIYIFMIVIMFIPSINKFIELLWQKILIAIVSFVVFGCSFLLLAILNKKYEMKNEGEQISPYRLSFVMMMSELIVLFLINSAFKTFFFEVNFLLILCFQAIVSLIEVPLNLFVNLFLLKIVKKIYFK